MRPRWGTNTRGWGGTGPLPVPHPRPHRRSLVHTSWYHDTSAIPTSYYTNDDGYYLFWSSSSTRQLIHTFLTERHPAVALALFLSKIRLN